MDSVAPSVSHRPCEQPSVSHTLLDGNNTCLMDLQALICLKQLFQVDCFCEVSPWHRLFALKRMTEGHLKTSHFFAVVLLPIKEERVRLWGKAICPYCVYIGGGEEEEGEGEINQSALNVGKQSQK